MGTGELSELSITTNCFTQQSCQHVWAENLEILIWKQMMGSLLKPKTTSMLQKISEVKENQPLNCVNMLWECCHDLLYQNTAMFGSIKYPSPPPTKGFFGFNPPPPPPPPPLPTWNFQFRFILSLNILALETFPPPQNFQWPSMGWVWIFSGPFNGCWSKPVFVLGIALGRN